MGLEQAAPSELNFHVDLMRTTAIVLVILLHAANEPHPIITQIGATEIWRWTTINIYTTIANMGVPLFVLISGALLLRPSKIEPMGAFFKKRLNRIVLPFVFWAVAYFAFRYFVNHETLNWGSIIQGIQTGPYYHFWFLYMIFGLYLITPALRVLVAHSDRKILELLLVLWFLGTAVVPMIGLFDQYSLDNKVFVIVGWVGFYILGIYLLASKVQTRRLYLALFLGLAATAVGTFFATLYIGGEAGNFFYNQLGATIILASAALFLLLRGIPRNKIEDQAPRTNWLLRKIGQNTLGIYLLHVMVLESFQTGIFGFTLSVNTLNPIVEVPLITAITLFICLGVIVLLKKVPYLKKMIG
jgi:surface polysaccharide O-acyltransferase-like enzyme